MIENKNKVIVIVGPTASGKSTLGINLAKKLNGEIISADSMQIYKNLNIGTAKVTNDEMQGVNHHLLDFVDVTDTYSVADFKRECYEKIDSILSLGKVPIVVGGTGLYVNAVVNNLSFIEEDTEDLKNKFDELYGKCSLEELVAILKTKSENLYNDVDLSNRRRVERALQKEMSAKPTTTKLWENNGSKYNFLVFYIDIPRHLLYDRINLRVDNMLGQGILDESKFLYDNIDKISNTATQAIGYKEFFPLFSREKSLQECVEDLKKATRHYAKRQITWFKKLEPKIIIDGTVGIEDNCKIILEEYYE